MRLGLFIFGIIFSSFANANVELLEALKCDRDRTTKTKEQLNAGSEMFKALYANGVERIDSCLGWTNFGEGDYWYIVDKKNVVHGADIKDKKHLGSWQLGALDTCENSTNPDCATPWWVGRWGADEFIEPEIRGNYQPGEMGWDQRLDTDDTIMGCMGRTPLRYGDIEGDSKKELAIFLLNGYSLDFVIFSPEKDKNIFTSKLEFNDALKHEVIFVADGSNDYMLPDESLPYYQYWSRSAYDTGSGSGLSQAFRGFAKLYVGHFESAQSNDILVWRKAYKSRLLTDSVKGFEKTSDNYIHYKLVDGEYKKQPTEQAVVKGWLEAKNLTWQKGYPSKSECPGQEGQLIPEMHDPLLNDPDVLK